MSVAATVSFCNQVGPDDWKMSHHTKVFDHEDTIETVLKWAQRIGGPSYKATINDIKFSEITE